MPKLDAYPIPKIQDIFATLEKRANFQEGGSESGISAVTIGGRVEEVDCHQYLQGTISVYKIAIIMEYYLHQKNFRE